MKQRIRIRRRDNIRQRYWVGRRINKTYKSSPLNIESSQKCYHKGCTEKQVYLYHDFRGNTIQSCIYHKPGGWVRAEQEKKNYGSLFYSPNRPIEKVWFNIKDINNINLSQDHKTIEGDISAEEIKRFELKPITDITDNTGRIDLDKFIDKHKIQFDKLERKGITKRDILGELTSVDKEQDVVKTIKELQNET